MTIQQYNNLTREQKRALLSVYRRSISGVAESSIAVGSFQALVARAQHTIGCDGAIAVPFASMWLLIETDGYTHS